MQLQNGLKVGDICFCKSNSSFLESYLVKIVELQPDSDAALIETLDTGKEGIRFSNRLLTLEQASHELYLLVKQAETLRTEVNSKLYSKYNSNEIN